MRLQVIDPQARFDCRCCGQCCIQPLRVVIEADRAMALECHDFSKYPQLAGRKLFLPPADGRDGFFDLAKGEGSCCIFFDADGLCIIHKELGSQAKPHMCLQFPFISSRTWVDERVSLHHGCPSVQSQHGRPLTQQADDIARLVAVSRKSAEPNQRVPLDGRLTLSLEENDAFLDRAMDVFADDRQGDVWTRFADLLAVVSAVIEWKKRTSNVQTDPSLVESLRSGNALPDTHDLPPTAPFDRPSVAPLPVRMLFAATLHPDTVPADLTGRMGFVGKLSLIPKLMTLASISGAYPSRLLGRNIRIDEVLRHQIEPGLDPTATQLLLRYFRTRFWMRTLIGTRLSILAGIHQHIHDFNAIVFFARAAAQHEGASKLAPDLVGRALSKVEFHLSNQPRVYDQTLKGWLRKQLDSPLVASQSLRLMAPADTVVPAPGEHCLPLM